ncbi:pyruvate kinase-like protein [Xylariaceae sp. AK1471]|nr:pyruvate kinase-like protein [Xylariaceae sp. AK1471]
MEVVAVSLAQPKFYDVHGTKVYTSIVHDPLTSASDYIELDEAGVLGNKVAVHDGPVYVCFAENYDHWCSELGVDRSSWGWCHWGENLTLRFKDKVRLEDDIHIGDIWRIGEAVRLQVCGARIPCMKLSWRCGQKDSWLPTLAASGRVGVYFRVLKGGRVHPGDQVSYENFSGDPLDIARITQLAFDNSLKTRDTINLLVNNEMLMRLNKWHFLRKVTTMDDKRREGQNAWKGFRDLRVFRIVDEGGDIKSFYLGAVDGRPLANYLPGQFLTIRLPNGTTRNWTISDWETQDEPSFYRVSIKKVGVSSIWMHDACSLNTILSARSPAGRFFLDRTSMLRQIYLSAGIGITPILAMMKAHDKHPNMQSQPAVWIHVAKDGEGFPFRDELPQFENRPFTKAIFFTKPRPSDIQGVHYDRLGRPDLETMKEINGVPFTWEPLGSGEMESEANFSITYICGPPEFETSMRKCMKSLGFRDPLIRSESFSASGVALGDVTQAKVRFSKSNVSATWTKDKPISLLELAESLGLTPDYGCRAGACGSCAAKLTCGSVSGGVQADGAVLTCSATPASEEVELEM